MGCRGAVASLPAVDLLMFPEHSLHREPLLADGTLERSLSSVRPHVFPQPRRPGETSTADVAHELQRPLVEQLVLLQLVSGREIFVAQEGAMSCFLLMFKKHL